MLAFQDFIKEKWAVDVPKRETVFPIYENPSSKDLVELRKAGLQNDNVRFAAIAATKKLYVWSGMDVIHDDALAKLVKEKIISRINSNNIEQAFCGECKLISGRLTFTGNDGMDTYFGPIIYQTKSRGMKSNVDSFLPEPYFELKDLLDDLPDIIARYKWVGKFIDEYETQSSPVILQKIFKK